MSPSIRPTRLNGSASCSKTAPPSPCSRRTTSQSSLQGLSIPCPSSTCLLPLPHGQTSPRPTPIPIASASIPITSPMSSTPQVPQDNLKVSWSSMLVLQTTSSGLRAPILDKQDPDLPLYTQSALMD